jgi:hypothetical protein
MQKQGNEGVAARSAVGGGIERDPRYLSADALNEIDRFYREDSIDARLRKIYEDPLIPRAEKKKMIASMLGSYDQPVQEGPPLGGKIPSILAALAGGGAGYLLTPGLGPLGRGLVAGLGAYGGWNLGDMVPRMLSGDQMVVPRPALSYSPFRGLTDV